MGPAGKANPDVSWHGLMVNSPKSFNKGKDHITSWQLAVLSGGNHR
jgi:hypothetical protein